MPSQHCSRCSSTRVRVGASRQAWRRAVCTVTPLRRYACQDCGHHGWTLAWLAPPPGKQPPASPPHGDGTASAHR